jgi:hypothetical protein
MLKSALFLAAALPLVAAPISQADREKLIRDLNHSRQMFLDAIADVKTEAQWNYNPLPTAGLWLSARPTSSLPRSTFVKISIRH